MKQVYKKVYYPKNLNNENPPRFKTVPIPFSVFKPNKAYEIKVFELT
jgi:hypothetical protein